MYMSRGISTFFSSKPKTLTPTFYRRSSYRWTYIIKSLKGNPEAPPFDVVANNVIPTNHAIEPPTSFPCQLYRFIVIPLNQLLFHRTSQFVWVPVEPYITTGKSSFLDPSRRTICRSSRDMCRYYRSDISSPAGAAIEHCGFSRDCPAWGIFKPYIRKSVIKPRSRPVVAPMLSKDLISSLRQPPGRHTKRRAATNPTSATNPEPS